MAERRQPGHLDRPRPQPELVELEPFLAGLEQDHDAAINGLTEPYSNGPIEGINTKTKLIKRQMYGHAGLALLRHRTPLGRTRRSPPKVRQSR
jgi:transposase